MSVVVGTAGHIDHGKTALLRALTGIDADRLPEERRRGMTIDVGYAHLALPDGGVIDFVDVPGHDRLIGNMLVGAGEIDAAMLVVAADDGPNAQTLEHLELLDALAIRHGLAVLTKADLADEDRRAELIVGIRALLEPTSLAWAPVLVASAVSGEGIVELRAALAALATRVGGEAPGPAPRSLEGTRLAVDRAFAVKGRGTVVTGTLRGAGIGPGRSLRVLPGGDDVRVREVQVRGAGVDAAGPGRTALLLGGIEAGRLRRGQVLTDDREVVATSRLLVALRPATSLRPSAHAAAAPSDRERLRLHLGTAQADALVVRGPREAIAFPDGSQVAILRLDQAVASAAGDRLALRRPSPGSTAAGGIVLDPAPPRGVSRRRLTAARARALAETAAGPGDARASARLDLHGVLLPADGADPAVADDVARELRDRAMVLVAGHHAAEPLSPGLPVAAARRELAVSVRRLATLRRADAERVAGVVLARLVAAGVLARDGDRLRDPSRDPGLPPVVRAAMDRLERLLSAAAPPPLAGAARDAGCPPDGVRALEAAGRIVRLEDDLAWAAGTYRELVRRALSMAAAAPLTPAAFRDATGTSRRYVLVILEDLDRRGLLRRTDDGHVLGPTTLARMRGRAAAGRVAAEAAGAAHSEPDA